MISNTLYNHDLHVILVRNLVFYELEKKLFVTPAEYAATEFDFRIIFSRHWHHDQPPSNPTSSAAKRSLNASRSLL